MTRFLQTLLDAEEPIFTQAVEQLADLTGKKDADAKLASDIVGKAHENLRSLGVSPLTATGPEIYQALFGRVEKDMIRLTRLIGAKDPEDVRHLVPFMIKAANSVTFNRKVFVIKREKAKDILRQMPPKKLMERLGHRNIEDMFDKEDFDEIYTALRFSEGDQWLSNYNELFKTVTADDYEERDMRIIQMDHNKYVDLAENFVKKKLHNVTHSKELGTIVVVPMRARRMRGLVLKTLPLLFHYMNELRLYSDFFKAKSSQPRFGKTVVDTLLADPDAKSQVVNGKIRWRVIQRYLAKHKTDDDINKVAFEPHVQPEDLHWRRAEELLYELDPELEFWKDRDYVALNYDGFPVSFNLTDVSFAYSNREPYENRYAYHFRESLWNEIFIRYMGFKNLSSQILEQLDNEMIAPEKLVVASLKSTERKKVEERFKKGFKLRENLIDSAELRLNNVVHEFEKAFDILNKHEKTVTIFGSARRQSDGVLTSAYDLSAKLAREGYAVVTGGSYGVMEAANRGAFEAGGESIGLNIMLPREQTINDYTTANFEFQHFFGRKVSMTLDASAYIYFPGGFGTLDELFEILVLEQTYKIPRAPIILVDSEFWRPFDSVLRKVMLDRYKTVSEEDMALIKILDDHDEIVEFIKAYQRKQSRRE